MSQTFSQIHSKGVSEVPFHKTKNAYIRAVRTLKNVGINSYFYNWDVEARGGFLKSN